VPAALLAGDDNIALGENIRRLKHRFPGPSQQEEGPDGTCVPRIRKISKTEKTNAECAIQASLTLYQISVTQASFSLVV
jgi:hypothetical protein